MSNYKSMIFLAGPRQSGKTTLAREIAKSFKNNLYFNWDDLENKRKLLENPYFFQEINRQGKDKPLVIFDEIHKYQNWKNYLKGACDRFAADFYFLVSGSGRLDIFQRGGDSLAGRYLLFHLWPLTLSELSKQSKSLEDFLAHPLDFSEESEEEDKIWKRLEKFTGFPEPFTKQREDFYKLWSRNYIQQLIREDIQGLSQVKNISNLEILFSLLSERVASPLSLNNLAGVIGVSFESIKNWLNLLERFFLIFRIPVFHKNIARSIVKEKKVYLFDYGIVQDPGARFENMVALELFSAISRWNTKGEDFSLHFIKNKEKQEVDFLITRDKKPFLLIECKLSEDDASKSLLKFQKALNIPAVQLVNKSGVCKLIKTDNGREILIISVASWLALIP